MVKPPPVPMPGTAGGGMTMMKAPWMLASRPRRLLAIAPADSPLSDYALMLHGQWETAARSGEQLSINEVRREEERHIPPEFDYGGLPGLSKEIVEKLGRARPDTLAQAGRISGVTPAALSLINVYLEKARRERAAEAATARGTAPERRPRRIDTRCNAERSGSPIPPHPEGQA